MKSALIALLTGDAALSALVGRRIYWVRRPQGRARPAIVLHRISEQPGYDDDGETGLTPTRVQMDIYGDGAAETDAIERALRALLSGYSGSVAGVEFRWIELAGAGDASEGGSNAAAYPLRTHLDFDITYSE